MIKIDGKEYSAMVTEVKRNFEVADSDSTGRTADWFMHRDVIGTFYNYTLTFDVTYIGKEEYDHLYETLSAPRASHTVSFPYGQGEKTFEAYVTKGSDALERVTESGKLWRGLTVNVIAMEPQRRA